mgnify:CR=1 FL=1
MRQPTGDRQLPTSVTLTALAMALAMVARHTSRQTSSDATTGCQTVTATKQRLPDACRRHSLLHSNSWTPSTPAAVRLHPRRLEESKPSVGDEVLGLRPSRGGCTKGAHQLRPAQIARAYKGVRAPASKDTTPLMRQYARLFGKDKGAAAWAWQPKAPAAAAALAAALREEERLFSKDKEAASFIKDKEAASLSLLKSCFAEARTALVKDREAASWQPMMGAGPWIPRTTALTTNAPAAAAAAAAHEEERLRCRRAELQDLQNLLADRLLSEDFYVAEVKRVLEKENRPETGLSLLASLAMPLRQAV